MTFKKKDRVKNVTSYYTRHVTPFKTNRVTFANKEVSYSGSGRVHRIIYYYVLIKYEMYVYNSILTICSLVFTIIAIHSN